MWQGAQRKKVMTEAHRLVASVRIADPDRALCAWFLPEPVRQDVFTLLAFHNEVTRALTPGRSAAVAGPMAAFVRLQWWRDVLEQTRPPEHGLAPALLDAINRGVFQRQTLLGILAARESELEPEPALPVWADMMMQGSGGLQCAIGEALGVREGAVAAALRSCGAAYGAAAMLRHWPVLQESGRFLFPGSEDRLRQTANDFLQKAQGVVVPPAVRVALLPNILAQRDLKRGMAQAGRPRGIGDKWHLIKAGLVARNFRK